MRPGCGPVQVGKLVPEKPEQMPSVGSLAEEARELQDDLAAAQLRTRTTVRRQAARSVPVFPGA